MIMYYLGVDVGSVSTDLVVMDDDLELKDVLYLRTQGDPLGTMANGMKMLSEKYSSSDIGGVGTTGSGRVLAGSILGADAVKNEITAHGVAAAAVDPDVRTILEIGGQDSKIIILENGVIKDFAMNTVCAAGTGAFLDRQAGRMNMSIEEFSVCGLESKEPVRIAGRCAVFAESDIIHKQQQGADRTDVISGVAHALVRNYLGNVARGKRIISPIMFQGGVSENQTICRAFEEELGCEITVPKYNKVMGAYGAALLAREYIIKNKARTLFRGFDVRYEDLKSRTRTCADCNNNCEITEISDGKTIIGCLNSRCGKHVSSLGGAEES
jgi:predicted CoA-substrate-specific enzyme activase